MDDPVTGHADIADALDVLAARLGIAPQHDSARAIAAINEAIADAQSRLNDIAHALYAIAALDFSVSPGALLAEIVALKGPAARDKGLDLVCEWTGPIPAAISTDATRLRQVLLNIVGNAIKFATKGSVRIIASVEPTDQVAPLYLRIEITDTGIGISEEQRRTLFQPFSQADVSMTRRFGGTGLGLSNSRELLTALGGDISVQSVVDVGTVFTIRIPLAADDLADTVTDLNTGDTRLNPAEAVFETAVPAANILLADDGPDNQLLIERVLSGHGHTVVVVGNGRLATDEALRAMADGTPYDVVLMDMQMPVLDGYAATAELRSRGYTGAIIALTAHAMVGEREKCVAAGCNEFIVKPFDRALLLRAIEAHRPAQRDVHRSGRPNHEDTGPLVSTYANDPAIADLVAEFSANLHVTAASIKQRFAQGDHAALTVLAHQLRGAASLYGFRTIGEAAARIEDLLRQDAQAPEVGAALDALVTLCRRAGVARASDAALQTILVVDDDQATHRLITARLRPEDVMLQFATDAELALSMVRANPPDLILLDLQLGNSSGLDLCRALKADSATSDVPIIFLTATNDSRMMARALESGAVDYVTKPFDAIELRARVRAALRSQRYQKLLQTRAHIDGLTGLWNRTRFDAELQNASVITKRSHRSLSLALLDIDHFKTVNDLHGHPFGDTVLRRVAALCGATLRASDVACRYGGEEFGIIMSDTDQTVARAVAERLVAAIGSMNLFDGSENVRVTVSVGVSTQTAGAGSAEELLKAADVALYRAKNSGRNRAVHAADSAV